MITPDIIFEQAVEAMGGAAALNAVRSIKSIADCTAPRGSYVTELRSARGDRLWFRQAWPDREPFVAVLNGAQAWAADPQTGRIETLDDNSVAMLRGHEFQMIPIVLHERFTNSAVEGLKDFAGRSCLKLSATDRRGQASALYFDPETHLSAGLIIANPIGAAGETVQIIFDEWRWIDRVQLPAKVIAIDQSGEFILTFTHIELNTIDDQLFDVPAELLTADRE
jgi:hypothetical protein